MTTCVQSPEAPRHPATSNLDQEEWLAARIGGRFFLETATAVCDAFDADLLQGLILLTIVRQNLTDVPGLSMEDDIARGRNSMRVVGPRRPATAYGVAKALGLNYETTRRHIRKLVDDGYCARGPDGVTAYGDILERPEIARTLRRLVDSMRRLTQQLKAAGLTEV